MAEEQRYHAEMAYSGEEATANDQEFKNLLPPGSLKENKQVLIILL